MAHAIVEESLEPQFGQCWIKNKGNCLVKRNMATPFSYGTSSSVTLSLWLVALILNAHGANGHLASFVSSDGKPNMTPRPIRGPTVPNFPEPGLTDVSAPRFPQYGNGYGPNRNMYFHHLRNIHPVEAFSNVGQVDYQQDKPTFVPYISPRALGNVNAYLKHLRDNLEALSSGESFYGDGDYFDSEDEDVSVEEMDPNYGLGEYLREKQQARRHAEGKDPKDWNQMVHWDSSIKGQPHGHNTRSFIDPHVPRPIPESLIRRTGNNYNPSWSYTKLGLGKRGRR